MSEAYFLTDFEELVCMDLLSIALESGNSLDYSNWFWKVAVCGYNNYRMWR